MFFQGLRLKIARVVPFLRWLAKDPNSAEQKVKTEVKETLDELKTEIKSKF